MQKPDRLGFVVAVFIFLILSALPQEGTLKVTHHFHGYAETCTCSITTQLTVGTGIRKDEVSATTPEGKHFMLKFIFVFCNYHISPLIGHPQEIPELQSRLGCLGGGEFPMKAMASHICIVAKKRAWVCP